MVNRIQVLLVVIFAIAAVASVSPQALPEPSSTTAASAVSSYSSNQLWLELTGVTNNVARFVIHTPQPNGIYDLLATTNLNLNGPGLNRTNWLTLMRTSVGQTNLSVPLIWPHEAWFKIVAANPPPVAQPETYLGSVNSWLSVQVTNGVLANDVDPNSEALIAVLVTNVAHGTLNLSVDGSFTYLPDNNAQGPDYFHYRAFNGNTFSEIISVKIGLQPNRRPSAGPATRWLSGDNAIHVQAPGVLVGASDADGDPVFARAISNQFLSSGFLTIATNGAVDYAGEPCFYASDYYNDFVVYSVDAYGHVQFSIPAALQLNVEWPAQPQVSWLSPTNGASVVQTNVVLRARVTDAAGCQSGVNWVEFYDSGDLIGTAAGASAPTNFTFIWTNAPIGSHALSAVAIVGQSSGTSSVVNINVVSTNSGSSAQLTK